MTGRRARKCWIMPAKEILQGEGEMKRCAKCKSLMPEDATRCIKCGYMSVQVSHEMAGPAAAAKRLDLHYHWCEAGALESGRRPLLFSLLAASRRRPSAEHLNCLRWVDAASLSPVHKFCHVYAADRGFALVDPTLRHAKVVAQRSLG